MSYEVRTEAKSDHLCVVISGAIGPGMAAPLADEVIQAYRREPLPLLLVDLRGLAVQVEPAEALQLVESYPEVAKGLRVKTAVVCADKNADAVRFYEMITQNRGYPTGVFTDVELALSWLRG